LHQVIGKTHSGEIVRYEDLPHLSNPKKLKGKTLADFAELRCHFHVPLFTELEGALTTTRDTAVPAIAYAVKENLTDNFVAETYTWNVLAGLAQSGNAAARSVVGTNGVVDVREGIVRELNWAKNALGM